MTELIKIRNDYATDLFFYLDEGSPEMLGIGVLGYHDFRTANIRTLNADFSDTDERSYVLSHEIGHGSRPKDSEEMRRYGDSVGDFGYSRLEYSLN